MDHQGRGASPGQLIGQVLSMLAGAEAAAAIGAELARRLEGAAVPKEVAPHLSRVASLTAPALDAASPEEQRQTLGAIRAFMRQAGDLLAEPERPPGWSYTDAATLDEQGRGSASLAPVLVAALASAGLTPERELRVLDIGTGAGWLAIALARALPNAHVVGIDIWEPALARAKVNVANAGLSSRVTIREEDAKTLEPSRSFDAAWVAAPFLPRPVLEASLGRLRGAIRPGGYALVGVYAGEGPVAEAVAALRAARSGGCSLTSDEATALLTSAGFEGAREEPRTWQPPVRLFVARVPEGSG